MKKGRLMALLGFALMIFAAFPLTAEGNARSFTGAGGGALVMPTAEEDNPYYVFPTITADYFRSFTKSGLPALHISQDVPVLGTFPDDFLSQTKVNAGLSMPMGRGFIFAGAGGGFTVIGGEDSYIGYVPIPRLNASTLIALPIGKHFGAALELSVSALPFFLLDEDQIPAYAFTMDISLGRLK